MKLTVINSGSSGNCYLLEDSKGKILMIECGVRFKEVLKAVSFSVKSIVGCIISHEHGDHAKGINEVLAAGIKVVASDGTLSKMGVSSNHNTVGLGVSINSIVLGQYQIKSFDVNHDAAQPLGFLVRHPELGTMLFLTDTYYCEYVFPGLTSILVEANYCENILKERVDSGSSPKFLRDRVIQSHLSLKNCKELLSANDLSKVNDIVLIHLSDKNSHAARFQQEVQELTGKKTHIAVPGLVIENFGLDPF